MKKLAKLICLILALVFTFSLAVGCGGGSSISFPASSGETKYTEKTAYTGGLHIGLDSKQERAGEYILSPEGKVNYTVVVPSANLTRVALAKADFAEIFLKATGKNIKVENETAVSTWDKDAKYISIGVKSLEEKAKAVLTEAGETALVAKLELDPIINANGFEIQTVGNTIFIQAVDEIGALFGAYELLTQLVDYQRYTTYFYTTDKVSSIPMYDFDIQDNPDFERRIGPWGAVYSDTEAASRMRWLNQYKDVYSSYGAVAAVHHNTLDYLPPEQHYAAHPEWYAQKGVLNPTQPTRDDPGTVHQLCYTAGVKQGDTENWPKYEAFVQAMADRVCLVLANDKIRNIIQITQEDNSNFCGCEACRAAEDHYGVIGGAMWEFTLRVNAKVQDWLAANQPWRERVLLSSFAYQIYKDAPATKNADGSWTPKTMRDGTAFKDYPHYDTACCFWSFGGDVSRSFVNDPVNKKQKDYIEGWQVCSANFGWWGHQTNWDNYFLPVNSFGAMQENYKALLEGGAKWAFNQGQQGNENLTGFQNFKMYLNSKWEWNVNLESEELTDMYFTDVYGPAKDIMFEFYLHMRAHLTLVGDVISGVDPEAVPADDPTRYPYQTVLQWKRYCEKAMDAIEPIKSENFELYEYYRKAIAVESLMPRYMIVTWYESSLDPAQLVVEKASLKADIRFTGFSQWKQHESVEDIMKDW